eukprot:6343627-Alexandrium_andersonii.AAC.1
MSASLVGSEMCIRDRQHIKRPKRSAVDPSRRRRRPIEVLSIGNALGTAVSYTHLTLPTICSV